MTVSAHHRNRRKTVKMVRAATKPIHRSTVEDLEEHMSRASNGGGALTSGSTTPRPDPTVMTIMALDREIRSLREVFDAKHDGMSEVFVTRLEGMDRAIVLLQTSADKIAGETREQVSGLRLLHEEKFHSAEAGLQSIREIIQIAREEIRGMARVIDEKISAKQEVTDEKFESIKAQFVEKDKATDKLSIADKTALAAALQTQKESALATSENFIAALSKMEGNFTKIIEGQATLLASIKQGSDEKINDLKGRMDRGEGKSQYSDPAMTVAMASMMTRLDAIDRNVAGREGKSSVTDPAMAIMMARLDAIDRNMHTQEGRASVSDPALTKILEAMTAQVSNIAKAQDHGEGRGAGMNAVWGYIVGAAGIGALLVELLIKRGI